MATIDFLGIIFLLLLFGATSIPNLKFLAYAYRELWPTGKNDPPRPYKGSKKPGLNRVKEFCNMTTVMYIKDEVWI